MDLFSQMIDRKLFTCPPNDAHAYALYLYTQKGDHIGFHYDTSYYSEARYTALIGLKDDSSCKLECELYTKMQGAKTVMESVKLMPGELVFFNGDKVRHRVTPSGANERRVATRLSFAPLGVTLCLTLSPLKNTSSPGINFTLSITVLAPCILV